MRRLVQAGLIAGGSLLALAATPARAADPAFLAVSAGGFDVVQGEQAAGAFQLEYRASRRFWMFKPLFGVQATTDGAVYGYAGAGIDLYFGRRWVFTPSIAAGGFAEGDGKDLDSSVQFRFGGELAYRFENRARLGLSFYHLSNVGVGDTTPTAETLMLTYALPLDTLLKRK